MAFILFVCSISDLHFKLIHIRDTAYTRVVVVVAAGRYFWLYCTFSHTHVEHTPTHKHTPLVSSYQIFTFECLTGKVNGLPHTHPMFVLSQFTHAHPRTHTQFAKYTPNSLSPSLSPCTEKCLSIIKFEMKIKVFQVWMLMCLLYVRYASNVNSFAVPNQSRKNTKTMYKWLSEFTNKMSIKTLKSFQIIVWQKNSPNSQLEWILIYFEDCDCDCCCCCFAPKWNVPLGCIHTLLLQFSHQHNSSAPPLQLQNINQMFSTIFHVNCNSHTIHHTQQTING